MTEAMSWVHTQLMASLSQGALSPDQFGTIGALARPAVPQKPKKMPGEQPADRPITSLKPMPEESSETGGLLSAAADANGVFKVTSLAAAL